jgi:predicted nucleotidyltransferase
MPTSRDQLIQQLQQHQAPLQAMGITSLALFGSAVRNQLRPDSDIDLLCSYRLPFTLITLHRAKRYLESALQRPVDLITQDGIHHALRQQITGEQLDVF